MWQDLPLFPDSASTVSDQVDYLYFFLVAVSAFFSVLIAGLVVYFAARYRRSRRGPYAAQIEGSIPLELFWTAVPLGLTMIMFSWGAVLYFEQARAPVDSMQFTITGKQWMWRAQHPTGQREINDLHVPVNVPIQLTMTSEDVIHSYFIPAFRVKQDVVPGRYSRMWFEATKTGVFDLFCAEYCGTKHSEMIGKIYVLEPNEYEEWLAGGPAVESPAEAGAGLFASLRCDTCHNAESGARGPDLAGRFGTQSVLEGGRTVPFDEEYVRQSILEPRAKVVAGYEPLMPTYAGQLNEDQILSITAYLKSIAADADGTDRGSEQ